MERKKRLASNNLKLFFYLLFIFGVLWHVLKATRKLAEAVTPYILFLGGITILLPYVAAGKKRLLLWILITIAFTLSAEIVGVKTGYIFGSYSYGEVLGPKILGVPFIVGFNWVLVILGALSISKNIFMNIYARSFIAGVLAVAFDLFLEPVAAALGYWNWSGGNIPIINYTSWFLIAFAASVFYFKLKAEDAGSIPMHYFLAQLGFFFLLNIFLI
jgi:putative membrane protein